MDLTPDDIKTIREMKRWMQTNGQAGTMRPVYERKVPRLLPKAVKKNDTISVYNASGSTVPQYGIFELDGTVQNEGELTLPLDAKKAIYTGIKPLLLVDFSSTTVAPIWNKRVVIAQEEIQAGKIGQCQISGITPVKVYSEKNPNPYQAHVSFASPLTRLDAQYHNSGFGFPILWREQGTGEKWALVNINHFDCPGFYRLVNGVTGSFFPTITSRVNGSSGWRVGDSGMTVTSWRVGSPQASWNTAVPIVDGAAGLRLQGNSTWLGAYSGSMTIHNGLSSDNNQPVYDLGNGYYPYAGGVTVTVIGDGVTATPCTYTPPFYKPLMWPYSAIGQTTPSVAVDRFNFYVPFIVVPPHNLAANQSVPIQIRITIGAWQVSQRNTFPTGTAPNYSWVRFIQMSDTVFSMSEVNPRILYNGPFSSAGGGPVAGTTPPAGPTFKKTPTKIEDDSSNTPPLSAVVVARRTQTLKTSYGGSAATPIP